LGWDVVSLDEWLLRCRRAVEPSYPRLKQFRIFLLGCLSPEYEDAGIIRNVGSHNTVSHTRRLECSATPL
jgi:hypothetical protein